MADKSVKSIRKAHTVYKSKDGRRLPGVSTILRLRAKEALTGWAFKMAREHPALNSIHEYVDDLAKIGSAAHALIASDLTGEPADLSDFTPNEVAAAQTPLEKFRAWASGHTLVIHASEKVTICEEFLYGGTLDLDMTVDGVRTLGDLKTGSSAYSDPKTLSSIANETFTQCAAYAESERRAHGTQFGQLLSLRFGRTEAEGMSVRACTAWGWHFKKFLALREVYENEWRIDHDVPYRD